MTDRPTTETCGADTRGIYPAIMPKGLPPKDPEWRWIELAVLLACAAIMLMALLGCSSTREEKTNEVQRETITTTTVTDPVVVDLPVGTATVHATKVTQTVDRQQTTDTSTHATTTVEPSPAVMQAATSAATAGLGVAGATTGLGAIAFGAWKLLQMRKTIASALGSHEEEKDAHEDTKRSLAETVKGIESAKAKLLLAGDTITGKQAWEIVRTELERKQSGDTQERVRALLS